MPLDSPVTTRQIRFRDRDRKGPQGGGGGALQEEAQGKNRQRQNDILSLKGQSLSFRNG